MVLIMFIIVCQTYNLLEITLYLLLITNCSVKSMNNYCDKNKLLPMNL